MVALISDAEYGRMAQMVCTRPIQLGIYTCVYKQADKGGETSVNKRAMIEWDVAGGGDEPLGSWCHSAELLGRRARSGDHLSADHPPLPLDGLLTDAIIFLHDRLPPAPFIYHASRSSRSARVEFSSQRRSNELSPRSNGKLAPFRGGAAGGKAFLRQTNAVVGPGPTVGRSRAERDTP